MTWSRRREGSCPSFGAIVQRRVCAGGGRRAPRGRASRSPRRPYHLLCVACRCGWVSADAIAAAMASSPCSMAAAICFSPVASATATAGASIWPSDSAPGLISRSSSCSPMASDFCTSRAFPGLSRLTPTNARPRRTALRVLVRETLSTPGRRSDAGRGWHRTCIASVKGRPAPASLEVCG